MPERYEIKYLPSPGALPGIPGSHAPGNYLIDWQERTATLVPDDVVSVGEQEAAPEVSEPAQPDETTPLAKKKQSK